MNELFTKSLLTKIRNRLHPRTCDLFAIAGVFVSALFVLVSGYVC